MNIYRENYKNIKILLDYVFKNSEKYAKVKVSGYMPLSIEILAKTSNYIILSLAHYYEQNDDLMADPEMEIKVSYNECTAKAISYRQDCFGIYKRTDDDKKTEFELNLFLQSWLNNLRIQGFYSTTNRVNVIHE